MENKREKKKDFKKAVVWIVNILQKNNIKFNFMGGLAAYSYGSKLRYNDIDLYMSLKDMKKFQKLAKRYVIEKPWNGYSSNKIWKGYIMRLRYKGINIDVTEANNTKIFNKKINKYERFPSNLSHSNTRKMFGMKVPVMAIKNLINYKSKLRFPNDLLDLKYLKREKSNI